MTDYYVFRTEAELAKGHADISLEPLLALLAHFPHLRVGYLIELKYLSAPSAFSAASRQTRRSWRRRRSCDAI